MTLTSAIAELANFWPGGMLADFGADGQIMRLDRLCDEHFATPDNLVVWRKLQAYPAVRDLGDGRIGFVRPQIFHFDMGVGSIQFVDEFWSYRTLREALVALDGLPAVPTGWLRHVPENGESDA